ncbi:MAG: DNA mismatch repair endonuclease MutL [Spirochaetaceae bacterium]|jgi:DNA mismatch repair protein MutL|nr:DNA mismatch repair endonuclease MutL [Spirochaetaceae bacterium]
MASEQTVSEIQILPPEEVYKIAAGEVVDRPAALVREFVDNALDAGATKIEVELEEGGIKKTEVRDNGCGISRQGLALAWQAHATSKIRRLSDLSVCRTLGFRGEALAAASAVSVLEIITSTDGHEGWQLRVGPAGGGIDKTGGCVSGLIPEIEPAQRTRGSTVRSKFLFDTLPARKRFLKRDGSEAGLCRQVFIDKALAFPAIEFRFIVDGKLKLFLPVAASKKERFCDVFFDSGRTPFVHEISALGKGFSIDIIICGTELARSDRRGQYVFANGRRIADFAMQQALEFGMHGFFPNGLHPQGAVFINIDPKLADFNLHPAKKETRFSCHAEIHYAITSALRKFAVGLAKNDFQPDISGKQVSAGCGDSQKEFEPRDIPAPLVNVPVRSVASSFARPAQSEETGLKFYGYLFGFFLLVADAEHFYIIDQHAAHERILYEKFLAGPIERQPLLVPIRFNTESADDDAFLEKSLPGFEKLGLIIKKTDGLWLIEELPVLWRLSDGETVREVLNLRAASENIAERWAATLACHAAIKDGDQLDAGSALRIARQALNLTMMRCPHGRPIMSIISKPDLFKAVMRD